eukprot:15475992-Alexandrium_andersonii.AAC.1
MPMPLRFSATTVAALPLVFRTLVLLAHLCHAVARPLQHRCHSFAPQRPPTTPRRPHGRLGREPTIPLRHE